MVTEYHPSSLSREPARYQGQPRAALEAIRPLVKAVISVHDQGMVHRDIKPENVYLSGEDRLVLGDFGIVFATDAKGRLTSLAGKKVGTTDWMAPWAYRRRRLDDIGPSFDVFPLGKLLWSMVSGEQFLPLWNFREDEFNLEELFRDDPHMWIINEILAHTVVQNETDCVSAERLLELVDEAHSVVKHRGQQVSEQGKRRCRVCARGEYVEVREGQNRLLALLNPRTVESGSPQITQVYRDPEQRMTVRAFACKQCGHVQLFHFSMGNPPPLWAS